MSLQASDLLWSLCSQTSLLMVICTCSHLVLALPSQIHLRSSGFRFSQGACNLDPSHVQFTVGFALLWDSNATADLTGGGAQAVLWDEALLTDLCATHLLLRVPVPNSPQTGTGPWPRDLGTQPCPQLWNGEDNNTFLVEYCEDFMALFTLSLSTGPRVSRQWILAVVVVGLVAKSSPVLATPWTVM